MKSSDTYKHFLVWVTSNDDAIHQLGNTEESMRRAGFGYIEHEMSTEYEASAELLET